MKKPPKNFESGVGTVFAMAYDDYPEAVFISATDGELGLREARRLRAWLDKAIAWMEEKGKS